MRIGPAAVEAILHLFQGVEVSYCEIFRGNISWNLKTDFGLTLPIFSDEVHELKK